MTTSELMKAMADAGAPFEAILIAVQALDAKDAEIAARDKEQAEKRARDAERKRQERAGEKPSRRRPRTVRGRSKDCPLDPPIEEDHTPSSVISPDGEKQKPRAVRAAVSVRPDEIPEPLWSAWVAHRRKHKADFSETTLAAYRREAVEVGWSLEQVMTEQIARGWRGFKAKWVKDDDRKNRECAGDELQNPYARAVIARQAERARAVG